MLTRKAKIAIVLLFGALIGSWLFNNHIKNDPNTPSVYSFVSSSNAIGDNFGAIESMGIVKKTTVYGAGSKMSYQIYGVNLQGKLRSGRVYIKVEPQPSGTKIITIQSISAN